MKLLRYLWISAKHLVLYGRLTVWIASDDETWRARSDTWFERGFCVFSDDGKVACILCPMTTLWGRS